MLDLVDSINRDLKDLRADLPAIPQGNPRNPKDRKVLENIRVPQGDQSLPNGTLKGEGEKNLVQEKKIGKVVQVVEIDVDILTRKGAEGLILLLIFLLAHV